MTASSIGTLTFFGVATLNTAAAAAAPLAGGRLRTAVACPLLFTSLHILCFTTFVSNPRNIGPVTREFAKSFTPVVVTTVTAYFGSSTAVQILAPRKARGAGGRPGEKAASESDEPRAGVAVRRRAGGEPAAQPGRRVLRRPSSRPCRVVVSRSPG
ncbi:MAG: hypothetical protein K2P78_06095 [Gemmataceae bacterium]|nr:hypothetical protein [Gemmataceae bacterium]